MPSLPNESSPTTQEVKSSSGSTGGSTSAVKPLAATAATTAAATAAATSTLVAFTREELLELVRAIKFAKPEASQKEAQHEVT
jgi:hypothetical protein